jgi:hypothetical protein
MSDAPRNRSFFKRRRWAIVGVAIAAFVVVFLAPVASGDPDGLDRVAEDKGFIDQARDPVFELLPEYSIPGIENEWASVVLAGLIGLAIVFGVTVALGTAVRASRRARS